MYKPKSIDDNKYVFEYDNMLFYFSSLLYLKKFQKLHNEYLKNETLKLKNKYNCVIVCDEMILLNLYKKIEKRGFKVYYNDHLLKENYYINLVIDDFSLVKQK